MAGQQAEHPDHTPAPPSLAEDAANFRCFIETIGDIVVIADRSGRLLYANPAAATTLGYSLDELRAMHMLDLHPAWVRQEAAEILADMFAGSRGSCPLPLIDRHGITIPVETRIWFGKWSGQDCVFGLVKDLTAEQEALQKFERLFRINPAPMAINSLNERRFVDVNAAFTSTLGYALEDVAGRTGAELGLFPDPLEQRRVSEMLARYGIISGVELQVRTRDGDVRDGLFSGEIFESQGQRFLLTVMIDITERKRAEAERERTIGELRSALEQIKTLKGIVPICANCKKIRDDRGFWEQVEAYITRHSGAEFSHSICPDCLGRLYADYKPGGGSSG